jgi:uncharacterized membrane protein YkoI
MLSGLLAASLFALAAQASGRPVPELAASALCEPALTARVAQRGSVSLEQAIAMAQSRYRGRVVRAETTTRGGRVQHEIRILGEDGRVRNVRIDAQSGQFQ